MLSPSPSPSNYAPLGDEQTNVCPFGFVCMGVCLSHFAMLCLNSPNNRTFVLLSVAIDRSVYFNCVLCSVTMIFKYCSHAHRQTKKIPYYTRICGA